MKPIYVCTGGCGGKVSAEQYAEGKITCGTPGCPKHGQSFDARQECEVCGATISTEQAREHTH